MPSMNKAMVLGHLGQDPELRHTEGGTSVCNFSVATTRKWKNRDGGQQEDTQWHRIVVWGVTAENCSKYLAKGSLVYLEGRLQTREWEDKEGVKKYTTEINAFDVQFLDKKGSSGGGGGGDNPPPLEDDDIPF